jgi:hypothetical protein
MGSLGAMYGLVILICILIVAFIFGLEKIRKNDEADNE